jgi:hypothetical protein
MRFSILHISDIHRDLNDEIPNEWLIDSLINDFNQFEKQDPKILKPALCVVTGDLIFGASPDIENSDEELKRQYNQAEEFLKELADTFFEGNRNSVVILPGNHDVCFKDVMMSLQKIEIPHESEKKKDLVNELLKHNSKLRWSWNALCFFKIIDNERYNKRFRYFTEMYNRFYQDERNYSLKADEQYDIFDYPDLGFCLVTLNSCFNNDPFHTAGEFHPTVITNACRALQKTERTGWLSAAAWHHNIFGGPYHNVDYLYAGFIQPLIDAGISLGFHGHQNVSDCFDERYRYNRNFRKITIISASTLCAEPKNLMPGIPRSYNVIELDTVTWKGRVHQRKMVNEQFSIPIWGSGNFITTDSSFIDFEINPPLKSRPVHLDFQIKLTRADHFIGEHKWIEAVEELATLKEDPQARIMLTKALEELGDNRKIITNLWPPQTIRETIILGGAILESGTEKECDDFIHLTLVSASSDASVREMRQRIVTLRCKK